MQHEHQAATAKGPQSSSGSVSLACPLFAVLCGGVGGAAAGRGCARAAAPSVTISGVRFVADADFAKRRSFALLPKRASVPAPPAAKPPAGTGGGTKSWPTSSGQWRRSTKFDASTWPKWCCMSAAPGGRPAAAARPRRGLGAVMLRTSAVAASPPGAGKKHMSSSHSNHSISEDAGGASGPAAALATLMPHGR